MGVLPAFLVPVSLLAEPGSPLAQGCFSHSGCMAAVLCVAFSLHWGCAASLWLLEEMSRTDVVAPPALPPHPAGYTAWCKWTCLCPVELCGEGLPLHAITSQVESTEASLSPGPPSAENLPAPWAWHFGRFGHSSM